MERKIGEVFEFEGKKLKVVESKHGGCEDCYLRDKECHRNEVRKIKGSSCSAYGRSDKKSVNYKKISDAEYFFFHPITTTVIALFLVLTILYMVFLIIKTIQL